MRAWVGIVVLASLLFSGKGFAFDVKQLSWNDFGDEFKFEDKELRGDWQDNQSWKGTLCTGYYNYVNQLAGRINRVDFDVKENNTIDAYADLFEIHTGLTGTYRSSFSGCVPLSGWYGIGIDRAQIRATISFVDRDDEPVPETKIQITSTELGRIRLGKWVPAYLERVITGVANGGLKIVWRSFLGRWISDKISKEIGKKLPKDRLAIRGSGNVY